ncbi:MAG TPA: LLM class F420-dependent oxidoreductase [bacterium]|jgi:probable F420-dependent oxidoreductase|nr:LLM class F420-dependent oxidoreductase [bacterium]
MRLGVVFPTTEIGNDPSAIAGFTQAAEALGYDHLLAYDHVMGAVPRSDAWQGYTVEDPFHEIVTLLAYLAGQTQRIELATGILILPQRQTVLVAKQAAEIDILSRGRLRLGVGIGWNDVEYEALGMDWRTRGVRMEEQVRVLRALWTNKVVTFRGRFHRIVEAGINPLPVQRPIPIWMGGESDAVLRRVARLADGWIPGGRLRSPTATHPQFPGGYAGMVEQMREYAARAGRDPSVIQLERRVAYSAGPQRWRQAAGEWEALGGTHFSISTMQSDLTSIDQHIEALRVFKAEIGGSPARLGQA